MTIRQITDNTDKQSVTRYILESLPAWFGIPESIEEYVRGSADKTFFGAYDGNSVIGFLYLKQTGKDTVELAVMGVLERYHRQGVGRNLFAAAENAARQAGYSFMQVKTVRMGEYEIYDKTNLFYISLGFKEFEVFPTLWDAHNPCQVYVMALRPEDTDVTEAGGAAR